MSKYIKVRVIRDGYVVEVTDREAREIVEKSEKPYTWQLRDLLDITYQQHDRIEDAVIKALREKGTEVLYGRSTVPIKEVKGWAYYSIDCKPHRFRIEDGGNE